MAIHVTNAPVENAAMDFINDGAAWIFSNAAACGSNPMKARQMRMNTTAAMPMRILFGMLFFSY